MFNLFITIILSNFGTDDLKSKTEKKKSYISEKYNRVKEKIIKCCKCNNEIIITDYENEVKIEEFELIDIIQNSKPIEQKNIVHQMRLNTYQNSKINNSKSSTFNFNNRTI